MGKHVTFSVSAWTPAQPAVVYALLRDGSTWPTWSPMDSFALEQAGPDGGESVGAVRLFRTGRHRSLERIVDVRPDERLAYTVTEGDLPIRDHEAYVALRPHDGGTAIEWHEDFATKFPGTGWMIKRGLTPFIQKCADGLASHAATITPDNAPSH